MHTYSMYIHMAVSTLFVTTASAEAPNPAMLGVTCCSSPPCPSSGAGRSGICQEYSVICYGVI